MRNWQIILITKESYLPPYNCNDNSSNSRSSTPSLIDENEFPSKKIELSINQSSDSPSCSNKIATKKLFSPMAIDFLVENNTSLVNKKFPKPQALVFHEDKIQDISSSSHLTSPCVIQPESSVRRTYDEISITDVDLRQQQHASEYKAMMNITKILTIQTKIAIFLISNLFPQQKLDDNSIVNTIIKKRKSIPTRSPSAISDSLLQTVVDQNIIFQLKMVPQRNFIKKIPHLLLQLS